jgi:membrane associated rhomboid family serine protease
MYIIIFSLFFLFTSGFAHEDLMHMVGNLTAMWLFGFKTYRALSVASKTRAPGFMGLYVLGAIGCSLAHLAFNQFSGGTNPMPDEEFLANLEMQGQAASKLRTYKTCLLLLSCV